MMVWSHLILLVLVSIIYGSHCYDDFNNSKINANNNDRKKNNIDRKPSLSSSLFVEQENGVMTLRRSNSIRRRRRKLTGSNNNNNVSVREEDIPSFLGYEKLKTILSSSIDEDMGSLSQQQQQLEEETVEGESEEISFSSSTPSSVWEEGILHEWQRADNEEAQKGHRRFDRNGRVRETVKGTSSFLVCVSSSSSSTFDFSVRNGYQRMQQMKTMISSLSEKGGKATEAIADDETTVVYDDSSTLYNKDDFTCMYSTMTASTARKIHQVSSSSGNQSDIIVQPLISSTKIRDNSIVMKRNNNENHFKTREDTEDEESSTSTITVSLCPSSSNDNDSTSSSVETLASNLIYRIQESLENSFFEESEGKRSRRSLLSNEFMWTKKSTLLTSSRTQQHHNSRSLMYNSILETAAQDPAYGCVSETLINNLNIQIEVSSSQHLINYEFINASQDDKDYVCSNAFIIGLSTQPEVCSVERVNQIGLFNDYAQWITQSNVENDRSFWDAGITGIDQIVQISDTGLDTDHCYFWDSSAGELKDGTVQSTRRKVVQYQPYADNSDVSSGHGTHVTGTAVGKRSTNGEVGGEALGFADGVAIDGKVAFFDIGLGSGCCSVPSVTSMFTSGINAGATIHSGSWGGKYNPYNSLTKKFDDFIHADGDFIALFAAGNDGQLNRLNTVGFPADGKNVITVGSHNSHGDDLAWYMNSRNHVSLFSSRGPTNDGRIKPDILAPGMGILSAGAIPSQTGECDTTTRPSYTGGTVSHTGLLYTQGTSMACPAAAGATLLIRQYLTEGFYPTGSKVLSDAMSNPSGTLLKAILINGAEPVEAIDNSAIGQGTTLSVMYDNHQGFGRVNLLNSLPLAEKNSLGAFIVDKQSLDYRATDTYVFKLDTISGISCDGTNTLSVTLVWNDPPSSTGCTKCVQNDLDLSLVLAGSNNGQTIFPNGRTSKDDVNNVERIRVDSNNVEDIFTVTVNAHNLISASQEYSLVATGCGLSLFESDEPTSGPSMIPSQNPSSSPTLSPYPSTLPTTLPTTFPSALPTTFPSASPTTSPSASPEASSEPSCVDNPVSNLFFKIKIKLREGKKTRK